MVRAESFFSVARYLEFRWAPRPLIFSPHNAAKASCASSRSALREPASTIPTQPELALSPNRQLDFMSNNAAHRTSQQRATHHRHALADLDGVSRRAPAPDEIRHRADDTRSHVRFQGDARILRRSGNVYRRGVRGNKAYRSISPNTMSSLPKIADVREHVTAAHEVHRAADARSRARGSCSGTVCWCRRRQDTRRTRPSALRPRRRPRLRARGSLRYRA